MFVLLAMFVISLCQQSIQIIDGDNEQQIINIEQENEKKIEITAKQTKRIIKYNNCKSTIGAQIIQQLNKKEQSTSEQICELFEKDIIFDDYQHNHHNFLERPVQPYENKASQKYSRETNVNDPHYYLNNPILTNIVRTIYGYAILSSNHTLYMIDVNMKQTDRFIVSKFEFYSFSQLRQGVFETQLPQLLYDEINYRIYIIFKEQIILGKLSDGNVTFANANITIAKENQFLGRAIVYGSHLYISQGQYGFSVFDILYDGDLQFNQQVKPNSGELQNIMIVDLAVGGIDNQYLYILDKLNGIFVYQQKTINDILEITALDNQFNIDLTGGYVIKVKERLIIVLTEHISYNALIEFEEHIDKNKILKLNYHILEGKYFDFQILEEYCLIRGVNVHQIIPHSIWSGFQKEFTPLTMEQWFNTDENEEYSQKSVVIPQMQGFLVHQQYYRKAINNSIQQVNVTHPTLVAITGHGIAVMKFIVQNPYLDCKLPDTAEVGDQFQITVIHNSTWCQEKFQKILTETIDFPNLMMCSQKDSFTLVSISDYNSNKWIEELYITFIAASIILIFFILYVAIKCYKKYHQRRATLDDQLGALARRGYETEQNDQNQISGF